MGTPPKEFWEQFKITPGAFSTAEALAIFNIVSSIKYSRVGDWVETYIELGSHRGKSSQAIAAAIKKGVLYCVEPEFENVDWLNDFNRLNKYGCDVITISDYSTNVLPTFNKLTFAFVDSGTHSDDLVMIESKMLEDKIIRGGVVAYHDKGSQFTKVDEAYSYLLSTGKYEEIKINWNEIFDYLKENNISEDDNNSWHKYPELPHPPNFIGALKRI